MVLNLTGCHFKSRSFSKKRLLCFVHLMFPCSLIISIDYPLVAQTIKNLPAMQVTWVGKIPWRRERPPTSVFWSGEFHRKRRSLVGYSPWGRRVGHNRMTFTFTFITYFKKNPNCYQLYELTFIRSNQEI